MPTGESTAGLRDILRKHRATAVTVLVLVASLLLLLPPVSRRLGPRLILWLYDLAVVLTALVATALSAALWRSFGRREVSHKIWAAITLGLLLWSAGEAFWAAEQLLFGNAVPEPSAADISWIAGYLPLTLGLYLRYRSYRIPPRTLWHALLLLAIVLALGLVTLTLAVPDLAASDEAGWLARAVNALYPVGDLLLAYWAILIVSGLAGGALFSPWRLIAAGFLCVTVSDLIFAYAVRLGLYQVAAAQGANAPTLISDWLYLASYLSIALGTYLHARLQHAI